LRAYLENVHVGRHDRDLGYLHDLTDDQQTVFFTRFPKQFERFLAQALEGIRRGTRLKGAAAQHARTRRRHLLGGRKQLLAGLHRARPRHNYHLLAADLQTVGETNHRAFRAEAAPCQLVRSTDAVYLIHTTKQLQFPDVEVCTSSHGAEHGLAHTCTAVHFEAHLHQVLDDLLNLLLAGGILHGNDHR